MFAPREGLILSSFSRQSGGTRRRRTGAANPVQIVTAAIFGIVALFLCVLLSMFLLQKFGQGLPPTPTNSLQPLAQPVSGGTEPGGSPAPPSPRTQLDDLNRKIRDADSDLEQLLDQKRRLEQEIKTLTTQKEVLGQATKASFVMLNPNRRVVAISSQGPAKFQLLATAEGELASLVDNAVYKSKGTIPRIDSAPAIVDEVSRRVKPGQELPPDLAKRIDAIVSPRKIRSASTEECVGYYDARRKTTLMGFLDRVEQDQVCCQFDSRNPKSIAATSIGPGTAIKGTAKDIFEVTGDISFIDYCVLEVVKAIDSLDSPFQHHKLVVQVRADVQTLAELLEKGDRDRVGRYKLLGSMVENDRWAFSVLGVPVEMRGGLYWHEREILAPYTTKEDRIEDSLDQTCRKIEAQVVAKLSQIGVNVLERKRLGGLVAEGQLARGTLAEKPTQDFAKIDYATHILLIDVLPAGGNAHDYQASARLVDAYSSAILWAGTADQYLAPPLPPSTFRVASGDLCLLSSSGKVAKLRNELPLNVRRLEPLTEQAVFMEEALSTSQRVAVRDLFSASIQQIPRTAVRTTPLQSFEECRPGNMMRVLAWGLSENTVASAGRIIKLAGGEAIASMRRPKEFVAAGDSFRVVRIVADYDGSERTLPYQLICREVGANSLNLAISDRNLEVLWADEDESQLQVGDLVVPRYFVPPAVAVLPAEIITPVQVDQFKLKMLENPARFQQIKNKTTQFAEVVPRTIRKALIQLAIPCVDFQPKRVVKRKQVGDDDEEIDVLPPELPTNLDCTHYIRATVQPVHPEDQYLVTIQLCEPGETAQAKTVVMNVARKLERRQLEEWIP